MLDDKAGPRAMATKLKPVDFVTVASASTGTILAQGAGFHRPQVVGIERGRWRDTRSRISPLPGVHDELKYVREQGADQDLSKENHHLLATP